MFAVALILVSSLKRRKTPVLDSAMLLEDPIAISYSLAEGSRTPDLRNSWMLLRMSAWSFISLVFTVAGRKEQPVLRTDIDGKRQCSF
jgi:hypothetical protein